MTTKGEKSFVKKVHQQRRRAENRKRQQEMIAREELEKRYKKTCKIMFNLTGNY